MYKIMYSPVENSLFRSIFFERQHLERDRLADSKHNQEQYLCPSKTQDIGKTGFSIAYDSGQYGPFTRELPILMTQGSPFIRLNISS